MHQNNPTFTDAQIEWHSTSVHIPMQKVLVFHKVKFWVSDPHGLATLGTKTCDVIHIRKNPSRQLVTIIVCLQIVTHCSTIMNNGCKLDRSPCSLAVKRVISI